MRLRLIRSILLNDSIAVTLRVWKPLNAFRRESLRAPKGSFSLLKDLVLNRSNCLNDLKAVVSIKWRKGSATYQSRRVLAGRVQSLFVMKLDGGVQRKTATLCKARLARPISSNPYRLQHHNKQGIIEIKWTDQKHDIVSMASLAGDSEIVSSPHTRIVQAVSTIDVSDAPVSTTLK